VGAGQFRVHSHKQQGWPLQEFEVGTFCGIKGFRLKKGLLVNVQAVFIDWGWEGTIQVVDNMVFVHTTNVAGLRRRRMTPASSSRRVGRDKSLKLGKFCVTSGTRNKGMLFNLPAVYIDRGREDSRSVGGKFVHPTNAALLRVGGAQKTKQGKKGRVRASSPWS